MSMTDEQSRGLEGAIRASIQQRMEQRNDSQTPDLDRDLLFMVLVVDGERLRIANLECELREKIDENLDLARQLQDFSAVSADYKRLKEQSLTTEELSQKCADAIYDAMNELDKSGPWVVHSNHFLPADVTTDYAGQRGLKNLIAQKIYDQIKEAA